MLAASRNKENPQRTVINLFKGKKEVSSIAEIMKDITTGIIIQMSSHLPLHMKLYSSLLQDYLRLMDSLFWEYVVSRKPLFDQIDSRKGFRKSFKEFSHAIVEIYRHRIESETKFLQTSVPVRIELLRIYDKHMQILVQAYEKSISKSFSNT